MGVDEQPKETGKHFLSSEHKNTVHIKQKLPSGGRLFEIWALILVKFYKFWNIHTFSTKYAHALGVSMNNWGSECQKFLQNCTFWDVVQGNKSYKSPLTLISVLPYGSSLTQFLTFNQNVLNPTQQKLNKLNLFICYMHQNNVTNKREFEQFEKTI